MYIPLKINDLNGTYRTVLASAGGIRLVTCLCISAYTQSYGTHFVVTDGILRGANRTVNDFVTEDLTSAIRYYNAALESIFR